MSEHAFGRLVAPDPRDMAFPMRAAVRRATDPQKFRYWWNKGWQGDQGATNQCVAYAWMAWIENGPVTHADRSPGAPPLHAPADIYRAALLVDEWPGEADDGTSVRAGAKVLQSLGLIASYRWAYDVETVVDAVLTTGPVLMGSYWYAGMMDPDRLHRVRPTGAVVGGHAYVIDGVSRKSGMARLLNSWGTDWGDSGRAWIALADLDLLIRAYGEACLAVEVAS